MCAVSKESHYRNSFKQTDYYGIVQTGQEGRYVLTDLAASALIVRVFAAKMYPQQWLVDASELINETVERDFVLMSAPILEGRILEHGIDKVYFNFTGQYTSVSGYASIQPYGTFTIVLAGSKEYEQNGERFTEQAHQYSACDLDTIEEIQQPLEQISYSPPVRRCDTCSPGVAPRGR